MFIDLFKNNGVPYLRLVESRRKTTKNGKLTSVKVPIFILALFPSLMMVILIMLNVCVSHLRTVLLSLIRCYLM